MWLILPPNWSYMLLLVLQHFLDHILPSWTPFRCSVARPLHWSPPSFPDSLCVGISWLHTQTSYPGCPLPVAVTSPTSWRRSLLCRVPQDVPAAGEPLLFWLAPPLSRTSPHHVQRASWGCRRAGRWWRCRSIPWGGRGAAAWGSGPPSASSWWSCEDAGQCAETSCEKKVPFLLLYSNPLFYNPLLCFCQSFTEPLLSQAMKLPNFQTTPGK